MQFHSLEFFWAPANFTGTWNMCLIQQMHPEAGPWLTWLYLKNKLWCCLSPHGHVRAPELGTKTGTGCVPSVLGFFPTKLISLPPVLLLLYSCTLGTHPWGRTQGKDCASLRHEHIPKGFTFWVKPQCRTGRNKWFGVQEATRGLSQDNQQWSHTTSVQVLLSLVSLMDEKRE